MDSVNAARSESSEQKGYSPTTVHVHALKGETPLSIPVPKAVLKATVSMSEMAAALSKELLNELSPDSQVRENARPETHNPPPQLPPPPSSTSSSSSSLPVTRTRDEVSTLPASASSGGAGFASAAPPAASSFQKTFVDINSTPLENEVAHPSRPGQAAAVVVSASEEGVAEVSGSSASSSGSADEDSNSNLLKWDANPLRNKARRGLHRSLLCIASGYVINMPAASETTGSGASEKSVIGSSKLLSSMLLYDNAGKDVRGNLQNNKSMVTSRIKGPSRLYSPPFVDNGLTTAVFISHLVNEIEVLRWK